MERRKCRRCGYPMTRIITQTIEPGGSHWKACYTCLSCGHKIVAAPAGSRAEAEKKLEDFAAMIDQEYKTADRRSAAPRKPQTAEADRALAAYEDGRTAEINGTYQICFAAVCLALNDIHGFGGKRCHRVLEKMQRYIVDCFTSADAVQAVYKRMGLTLDFGDPLNWIELGGEEE